MWLKIDASDLDPSSFSDRGCVCQAFAVCGIQGYREKLEHLSALRNLRGAEQISGNIRLESTTLQHAGHVPYNTHSSDYIILHRWTPVKRTASPRLRNYNQNYVTLAAREQILCNYIINHAAIS